RDRLRRPCGRAALGRCAVPLDPQIVEYLKLLAATPAPPVGALPAVELRAGFEASAPGFVGPVDEVASVEDLDADGVRVRVYRPVGAESSPALVYFHGGGWVIGSVDTHDGITRALARRAGCIVVSVGYRLAPEHPFPAGLDDAWTSTRWVLASAG